MISSGVWERDVLFGTNDEISTVFLVEIHWYYFQYLLVFTYRRRQTLFAVQRSLRARNRHSSGCKRYKAGNVSDVRGANI